VTTPDLAVGVTSFYQLSKLKVAQDPAIRGHSAFLAPASDQAFDKPI
jgi:hypothetical protein